MHRRIQQNLRVGCALTLLCVAANVCAGETPEAEVRLLANEIYIGESVDIHVTIKNTKNPSAPDMSAFNADFGVAFIGDQSLNQSSVFIVNGRKSENQTFGHVYGYRLTPKKAGDFTLPAPVFTIDGQKIAAPTAQLHVQAPDKQDQVIVELDVSKPRVYPTQSFDVLLRILVKPLPGAEKNTDPLSPLARQPPHIDLNWVDLPDGLSSGDRNQWLRSFVTDTGIGFTLNNVTNARGFFNDAAVLSLQNGRATRTGLDGSKIEYFVYELKRTITAEKAGSYTFGPASVKGTFADAVTGRRNFSGHRYVAFSPAQVVEVRDVPTPRPATFSGGIGNYRVSASANPTTLRVGDPLTYVLEIQKTPNSGSLDLVSAPDLTANEKIAAEFDIIDKAPTGEVKNDVKKFSYGLRPKKAGVGLPALTLTVFNPDTEKFSELTTAPIALNITQTAQVNAGELVGALPSSQTQEIKSRAQGIFQNVTDVSEIRDQHVNATLYAALSIGAWMLFGALTFVVGNWRRKSGDVVWQRRSRARRAAEQSLNEARSALKDSRNKDALKGIRDAIVGLIADMRNIPAAGMTSHEADAALSSAGVAGQSKQDAVRLLESIEAAEYGSAFSLNVGEMIANAEKLIAQLHRELEARA
jgi:hypothetical protein